MTRTRNAGGAWRRLAVALALLSSAAAARPYQVEDMLGTEGLGQVRIAPGGRWLVFEREGPLGQVDLVDFATQDIRRTRLFAVDLTHPGEARPLLDVHDKAGTVMLGFSPAGSRLAVARLDGWRWRLGVVTLATRQVRWFDLAPDTVPGVSTWAWMSEDRLVTLAQAGDRAPWQWRQNAEDEADQAQAWRDFAGGATPTVTAIGSGPRIEDRPPPAPKQLVVLDVTSGEKTLLGEGDYESLSLSPDRRHVALHILGAMNHPPATPISEMFDWRQRDLRIVDLEARTSWTPCPRCDAPLASWDWSADGHRLLFYARPSGQGWEAGSPWVATMDGSPAQRLAMTGIRPVVAHGIGVFDGVGLGWRGPTPLIHAARTGKPGRAGWFALDGDRPTEITGGLAAPAGALLSDVEGRPVVQDGKTAWALDRGRPRALLTGMDGMKRLGGAGEEGLAGWRRAPEGMQIMLRGPRGRTVRLRTRGADDTQLQDASLDAKAAAITATRPNGVTELKLVRANRAPVVVATLNRALADVTPPTIVPIRHRLPGGQAVTSWLYRPSAGPTPPLIVIPYPGRVYGDAPPALWNPGVGRTYTNVATLVGHGYAVLLPSMPDLPPSDAHPFDFAGQILSAVDAAIAAGYADSTRLGLWGHSYGGYSAATVASETNRFKAIVASSGIYDLTSSQGQLMAGEQRHPGEFLGILFWAGWTETIQPRLGGNASSLPATYVANSPVYHADKIHTPMLIVGEDRDIRPVAQAEEMFSALYRQDKEARLLSYWGESHTMASPANVRDLYARVFAWFDDHFVSANRGPSVSQSAGGGPFERTGRGPGIAPRS